MSKKRTSNEDKLKNYLNQRSCLKESYERNRKSHSDRQGELCRRLVAETAKALRLEVKLYGAAK